MTFIICLLLLAANFTLPERAKASPVMKSQKFNQNPQTLDIVELHEIGLHTEQLWKNKGEEHFSFVTLETENIKHREKKVRLCERNSTYRVK